MKKETKTVTAIVDGIELTGNTVKDCVGEQDTSSVRCRTCEGNKKSPIFQICSALTAEKTIKKMEEEPKATMEKVEENAPILTVEKTDEKEIIPTLSKVKEIRKKILEMEEEARQLEENAQTEIIHALKERIKEAEEGIKNVKFQISTAQEKLEMYQKEYTKAYVALQKTLGEPVGKHQKRPWEMVIAALLNKEDRKSIFGKCMLMGMNETNSKNLVNNCACCINAYNGITTKPDGIIYRYMQWLIKGEGEEPIGGTASINTVKTVFKYLTKNQ